MRTDDSDDRDSSNMRFLSSKGPAHLLLSMSESAKTKRLYNPFDCCRGSLP